MNLSEMRNVVAECTYPNYEFSVTKDSRGAIYLQASYLEPGTTTGIVEKQVTRRWFLSPAMVKSEIVQTCFKCVLTSAEHRTREWFKYHNRPIFGPHFNVDVLWSLCCEDKNFDYRRKEE